MFRSFDYLDILYLIAAVRWTLLLTMIAFCGGAIVGLVIAIMRTVPVMWLRWFAALYVQVVQGTPLLVWLFLLYFGVASLGFDIGRWTAATLAFSLYGGAFLGEVWRGAIASVAKTQWEAAASLGLSLPQQLRYIIVPQSVRIAIPPTVGFLVQLIKNTSLVSIIGLVELTREGQLITASTFSPLSVYLTVSMLYFLICFPLTRLSRSLERKINVNS